MTDEKTNANQSVETPQVNQPVVKEYKDMTADEMRSYMDGIINQSEVKPDEGQGSILGETTAREEIKPQTEEATEQTAEARKKVKVITDKYEHEIEYSEEDLPTVFQKAYYADKQDNFYKKNKQLITKLEKAGIGENDIDMLLRLKQGDKQAYASIMKANNIDALDLDLENAKPYVADTATGVKLNPEIEKKFNRINVTAPDVAEKIVEYQNDLPVEVAYAIADNEVAFYNGSAAISHFDVFVKQIADGNFERVSKGVEYVLATQPKLRTQIALDPNKYWELYASVGKDMGILAQNQSDAQPAASTKTQENLLDKAKQSASSVPPKGAMPSNQASTAETFEQFLSGRGKNMTAQEFRQECIKNGWGNWSVH